MFFKGFARPNRNINPPETHIYENGKCEYCNLSACNNRIMEENSEDRTYMILISNDNLSLQTFGYGYRDDFFIKINYCPMCGRKMNNENP